MILAIGFRARSARATQFRRWAAETLSEYLVKGFVMDDAKLKDPFAEAVSKAKKIETRKKLARKGANDAS